MRPKILLPKGTTTRIEKFLVGLKDLNQYKKAQCIYLRAKFDYDAEIIAKITGYKPQTVRNIQSAFIKHGIKSLKTNIKGGRYNSILTVEEEKILIDKFDKEGKKGGIIEVSKIHKAIEEKANKKVAKSTTYRMLDRHECRKIMPRPYHPKSNLEKTEQFKKTLNI